VYSGIPAGGPDPGVFFTRWVTHFCAPGFAFFAGTSAFLYGLKTGNSRKLAGFLVSRGLILVVLELTLLRFFWAFNINYQEFILAGVIWMLGWCMVLLAALVWLPPGLVGVIGTAVIVFQSWFSRVPQVLPESIRASFGKGWEFIYPSGFETFSGISVLYSLVPWIGVMAAGYGFGYILSLGEIQRRKAAFRTGLLFILLFLILGSILILRSPEDTDAAPFLFRLLNQQKYPASPLFLLMTLGPLLTLLPVAEKMKGGISKVLEVFGRVPFYYYLLHIPLIHLSALVVYKIKTGSMHHEFFTYAPYAQVPETFRWSLPLLYLVFTVDVVILYFLCRGYAGYKARHPEIKWLRYI
jgi:uncharacterized membrane protein